MKLTLSNLTEAHLLACDTIALGCVRSLCIAYGRTVGEFIAARRDLWCHEVPANQFRHFLATGK